MTEPDEETKEQPAYPDPPPAPPGQAAAAALDAAAGFPGESPQSTTTISTAPPPPPGTAPIGPGMAPPPPPNVPPPGPGLPGEPAGYPPQQGQWQGPGYGAPPGYPQPGYGQPAYGTAGYGPPQTWGAPRYRTSVIVVFASLVLILFGLALAVLGAWLLTQGPALSDLLKQLKDVNLLVLRPDRDQLRSAFSLSPGVFMVFGLLQLLIGAVILAHRGWARWLGLLLAFVGLVISVFALPNVIALVPGVSVQLIVVVALVIGYAIALLALIAGGGHFRAQYPGR